MLKVRRSVFDVSESFFISRWMQSQPFAATDFTICRVNLWEGDRLLKLVAFFF
jgi:hypothetical protein